ncbi:MAG: hypothetical protein WCC38_09260 [Pseudonocardiaceae bacterium]
MVPHHWHSFLYPDLAPHGGKITDEGLVWHSAGMAQADHAVPWGNIPPNNRSSLPGLT